MAGNLGATILQVMALSISCMGRIVRNSNSSFDCSRREREASVLGALDVT